MASRQCILAMKLKDIEREKFDGSQSKRQIHQYFPPSINCTIQYVHTYILICNCTFIFHDIENDYKTGPFSISIPAGKEEESFNVPIKDDDVYESDESFELVINRVRLPSRISRAHKYTSTVTILNNEKCKYYVSLYIYILYICIVIIIYTFPTALYMMYVRRIKN